MPNAGFASARAAALAVLLLAGPLVPLAGQAPLRPARKGGAAPAPVDSTARPDSARSRRLLGVPIAPAPPPATPVLGRPAPAGLERRGPPILLGVPVVPTASAALSAAGRAFLEAQLGEPRVRRASVDQGLALRARFRELGIAFPPAHLYLRAFKREHLLEAWVQPRRGEPYRLLESFPICAISGTLGPKHAVGDDQTPEGFYHIDGFNPRSEYWLALALDYPNRADSIRARGRDPGEGILLHGGCRTAGCLPLTNAGISRLYWLAVQARVAGQRRIPLHIFPTRLDSAGLARLDRAFHGDTARLAFWASLAPGYRYFELRHRVPDLWVDAAGLYHVQQLDPRPRRDSTGVLGVPAPPAPAAPRPPAALHPTGTASAPAGSGSTTGPAPARNRPRVGSGTG